MTVNCIYICVQDWVLSNRVVRIHMKLRQTGKEAKHKNQTYKHDAKFMNISASKIRLNF